MALLEVNDTTLQQKVRKQGVTVVDFGAVWCPPCKALLPIMNELQGEYGEQVTILKVDCDESPELAAQYGVMSMPTVLVFHDGEPVEKLVGLRPKNVYATTIAKYM
ncbi:MAG: trxA [Paenibacillus sp.]|nr:trxA [Paenibacillus sp.]